MTDNAQTRLAGWAFRSETRPAATTAPRTEEATRLRHGRPQSLRQRTLLRFGVWPLLLACDVTAWAVAAPVLSSSVVWELVLLIALVAGLHSAGLYRSRLSLSVVDDLPHIAARTTGAVAAAIVVGALAGSLVIDPLVLLRVLVLIALCAALRGLTYAFVHHARRRGWVQHRTLILGAGRVGGQLARLLQEHPEYGLVPVGFVDGDPLLGRADRSVPLLGGPSGLETTIVEFDVQTVIVAFSNAPEPEILGVLGTCDRLGVDIFSVPRLFELQHPSGAADQIWGIPLVRRRRGPFRTLSWRLKRVMDVVVAGLALLVLSPVLAACALAVRWEGGPGVLFRQSRVGLDGKPFDVLKLRSLRPVDDAESATQWSISTDARLGPVGRFLRVTSLDELPQLWNVLRGDMSLVGPRPERPYFVDRFADLYPRYTARHRVPAGVTGWAQVHGLRGNTSIEDRARFDNYYIENWSLWLDVKIHVRTVVTVLRGTGS